MVPARSTTVIIILVFGFLLSALYASSQISAPRHPPDIIPFEPKISQLEVIETVEQHLRSEIPHIERVRLYYYLYNFTNDQPFTNPEYSEMAIGGWPFSYIKENPELLHLSLFFVHANGTQYQINSTDGSYQIRCLNAPDLDNCAFSKPAEHAVRDRLVYRTESTWYPPAYVSPFYSTTEGYHVIDAETGELVWNTIDSQRNRKPMPPNVDYEGHKTVTDRLNERLNPPEATQITIVEGASDSTRSQNLVPREARTVETISNRVVWTNKDTVAHTVRSDEHYSNPNTGDFVSHVIEPNQSYEYTFIDVGEYPYHCEIHPWIRGNVEVVGIFA